MIRIHTTTDPVTSTVTVDGHLSRDYVEAVQNSIHQALAQARPVRLYLRNVSGIDDEGRKLLAKCAARGVELCASGLYCSYVVEEIRKALDAGRDRGR